MGSAARADRKSWPAANLSLEAGLSMPDDWTAQVQYYLIVINYPAFPAFDARAVSGGPRTPDPRAGMMG